MRESSSPCQTEATEQRLSGGCTIKFSTPVPRCTTVCHGEEGRDMTVSGCIAEGSKTEGWPARTGAGDERVRVYHSV